MIQRIQTLYLAIAELLIAMLFFVPLADLSGKEGNLYALKLTGIIPEKPLSGPIDLPTTPMLLFAGLLAALLMFIIFQYKSRPRQTKLSYLAATLLIVLNIAVYFYIWKASEMLGGGFSIKPYFSFPIVAAIFVYLAIRGIIKDEQLVKSIDRIR